MILSLDDKTRKGSSDVGEELVSFSLAMVLDLID